jgi:hypothetical protein
MKPTTLTNTFSTEDSLIHANIYRHLLDVSLYFSVRPAPVCERVVLCRFFIPARAAPRLLTLKANKVPFCSLSLSFPSHF